MKTHRHPSMTKSRELDEVQSEVGDVNKRHYGEGVKFYLLDLGDKILKSYIIEPS